MKSTFYWHVLIAIFVASVAGGCKTISWHCDSVPVETLETNEDFFIDVGGLVEKPGRIPIGSNSEMTLRRVLALAGGPRQAGLVQRNVVSPPNERLISQLKEIERAASDYGRMYVRSEPTPTDEQVEALDEASERLSELVDLLSSDAMIELNDLSGFVADFHVKSGSAARYRTYLEMVTDEQFTDEQRRALIEFKRWDLAGQSLEQFLRDRIARDERIAKVRYDSIVANSSSRQTTSVVESNSSVVLVAIESAQFGQRRYLIPYSLIRRDLFGEIVVQPGALINVMSIENTSLRTNVLGGANDSYSVTGLVKNPGLRRLSSMTIGALTESFGNEDPAVQLLQPNSIGNVWSLTRAQPTGIGTDVFILPRRWFGQNQPLAKSAVLNGDRFQVLNQVQVPIVTRSLVKRALTVSQRPFEGSTQTAGKTETTATLQQREPFVDRLERKTGPFLSRGIRNIRSLGQQTKTRLGL